MFSVTFFSEILVFGLLRMWSVIARVMGMVQGRSSDRDRLLPQTRRSGPVELGVSRRFLL